MIISDELAALRHVLRTLRLRSEKATGELEYWLRACTIDQARVLELEARLHEIEIKVNGNG